MNKNKQMMITTRTTFIAVASLMTAACSQMESPMEDRTPVVLKYSTVDATETKAAQNLNEGTFDTGEIVKVRISNTGAGSWTDYDFTTGESGAMSPAGAVPYYPAGAQNIDIVALYPSTAGTSFSVQTDQTADAAYKASDLMFASVTDQAKQAGAVGLAFSHKMAKINVNITAGTGVGSITGVSLLNVKPTVSFDPATGTVGEAGGTATSIAMGNNGSAVIPAQTISGGLLSIVTDRGTATYTVIGKEFAAGQRYTINITVNLRAVGTTNAIAGWMGEGTVNVDAERPKIAGHEYVDMGTVTIGGAEKNLKWATCNGGATNPWDYGDYYAWGETTTKTEYHFTNYFDTTDGGDTFIKYNVSGGLRTLSPEDDAARQCWGDTWRIPTDEEWTALRDATCYTWTWTDDYLGDGSNHKGRIVTRNNVGGNDPCAGNSIFLPAAGRLAGPILYEAGSGGYYWSSSLYTGRPSDALRVNFDSGNVGTNVSTRFRGQSVRPVAE